MENIDQDGRVAVVASLVGLHGEAERARIEAGVASAAALWRSEDGDAASFRAFCGEEFAPKGPRLDALYARLAALFEEVFGSGHRMSRAASWAVHVDGSELLPLDEILSAWDPLAHLADDWFANKLLFVVRLNFPRPSLAAKLSEGARWSRRAWAEARLAETASERVPAAAQLAASAALSRAESYIAGYNIHAACLVDGEGPLYAEDKKLLMHWNVRDEIKALYGQPGCERRQRALFRVMERAIDGSIPAAAIDGQGFGWNPWSNILSARAAGSAGGAVSAAGAAEAPSAVPDGTRRYALMLDIAEAMRGIDAWSPDSPTLIARRFDDSRELSMEQVTGLLESLFGGDTFTLAAARVREALGRPLEAFDIWFRESGGGGRPDEAALDAVTRRLYPTAAAFEVDIPRILRALGFGDKEADWLASSIAVDPARGSGHAMPAAMRSDKVRLRTRVGQGGMDYKGYNIACHELGHNVEQVYSLHGIDEYFLAGVPNTAFTEAFAFVFQARDLEVLPPEARLSLGLAGAAPGAAGDAGAGGAFSGVLADYWQTCEIAGVGLVDMAVWGWLYAHPGARPEEFRDAVLDIARSTWNRLFAPAFGLRDSTVLAVYSHMIENPLYLCDYPMGHLISFQIEDYLKGRVLGEEMGRMCRLGRLTPSEWMREALGGELSAAPLIAAVGKELRRED
jgi:hypothetical protein